jgi:hypothetical protein
MIITLQIACLALSSSRYTNEPSSSADSASQDSGNISDTDTSQSTDTAGSDTATDTDIQQADGPILYFEDDHQVGGTNQWGNLWPLENGFLFSTMQNEQVAFRRYDLSLSPVDNLTLVTTLNDFPAGVQMSDHEMLRLNNALFFVASGFGDEDLIIIKTDLLGNRLDQYNIQEGLPIACNDPHLLIVNNQVCVRWGTSGVEKYIQCFDDTLRPSPSSPALINLPEPIPQLGFSLQVGNEIWSFTGDAPQRDLIISKYELSWLPKTDFSTIILPSENDNWNWFPGGVAHHEEMGLWFVAYTHMKDDEQANFDSVVHLAAFNENFELLDDKILSDKGYTRPNLALIGDKLIVSYDNGNLVWLERWLINPM